MAREVRVAILGDSRDYSRAVQSAIHDSNRLDRSFSSVSDGAGRMGRNIALAATGGIVVGATAVASFIHAAEEAQQVSRQTDAVLRSMGTGANVTAAQIARLAEHLSLATGIDDELIQSGQNILLTFGQVRNEFGDGANVFDRATEAALNMSVALGTDMNSAAMMVGKALNDPIRGLTALRRSGIQFTEEQEEQIRVAVAFGDTLGAQRIMLGELERQFGGSAEAQATASQKIGVAWDNIKEQIGTALLPAFEKASDWLVEKLPGAMKTAGGVVDGLKVKWEGLTTAIFGEGDWDSFWSDVKLGWEVFKTDVGVIWDIIKKDWETVTTAIFGEGDWESFWDDVKLGWKDFQVKWDIFLANLALGWEEFTGRIGRSWKALMQNLDEYTEPFITSVRWLVTNIGKLGGMIGQTFGELGGAIDDFFSGGSGSAAELAAFLSRHGVGPAPAPAPYTGIGPSVTTGAPLPFIPRASVVPAVPRFADGGVMPGPRGVHSLALVAGGETILPTHRGGGGITLVVNGEPDDFTLRRLRNAAVAAAEGVRRSQGWSVG